ncbi:MAG: hypothetical protein K6B13_01010 [Prevotella sp.]|nr:hypothetical protein [Prevotella sp.]
MGKSIDNVWAMAQRLSPSERLALSRRLAESVTETESACRENALAVVTHNTKHFSRIEGLKTEDWLL